MLIGEYRHSIDPKKRLAVPAKLRKELGEKVVLTRGLDSCLFLFPMKDWEALAAKLNSLPMGQGGTRGFVRLMLAGAGEIEIDKLGRVLVPDYLKQYANLKKNVVIVGLVNRLEIWEEARWNEYKSDTEKQTGDIAEKLGELGVL
ncbi:division/cell wall cluster transcriptional repressor MraZ [Candidatus Parcubacteria bacterium]|nr:division/cell wall cluster transcriptional repressor MraZ [Candidatus Parcubacteria bacterium]